MKNLFLFLLLPILPFCNVFSQNKTKERILQESKSPIISTRIGLNSMNEASLFFEFPINEKRNFVGSIGYNWGTKGWNPGSLFCNKSYIVNEGIKRKGFITRAGVRIKNPIFRRFESRVLGIIAYGFSPNIEKDEGCHSGSNSADYEKYDFTSVNIGVMHYWDRFEENKYITAFVGLGVISRSGKKTNYIKGSYSSAGPQPDESHGSISMIIDFGLRIRIY